MAIEGFTCVTPAKDRNIIVVIQVPAEMCDGYSEAMSAKKNWTDSYSVDCLTKRIFLQSSIFLVSMEHGVRFRLCF